MSKLLLGDCLEIMSSIRDSSIDMVLCDLPFGQTAPKWDLVIPIESLWEQYKRIIKDDAAIVLFGQQPFTSLLIQSNLKQYRHCWYWIKNQSTNFFNAKKMPLRKVEEIVVFSKKPVRYFPQVSSGHPPTHSAVGSYPGKAYHGTNIRAYSGGVTTRQPTNVLFFKCVHNYNRLHSAQKPASLLKYLIKTYTQEGELVLDNCAGSCSTAIAAESTNRKWICIEKDPDYYEIGKKRISEYERSKKHGR